MNPFAKFYVTNMVLAAMCAAFSIAVREPAYFSMGCAFFFLGLYHFDQADELTYG